MSNLVPGSSLMSVSELHTVKTRFSDLDTQRHTTSRTYEDACLGDRYRILEEAGYDWKRMVEESVRITTIASDIRFLAQQMENTELGIRTETRPGETGVVLFTQEILGPNGKIAAEIRTLVRIEKGGQPLQVLTSEESAEALVASFESILPFSGRCERAATDRDLFYCERNPFGEYNPSHYWRLLEEGRWHFTADSGLSLEDLVAMDTTLFYMGGKIRYHRPLIPGRKARVRTWIRNFEKIWSRMRQEITDSVTGEILAESLDDLLVVSVSKARPKKPPEQLVTGFARVTEFPEGGVPEGES